MKYFKKLLGDNIYLSPRSMEDAEKYTEWLNDYETTDYIGRSGMICSLEAEKRYLEESEKRENDIAFAIIELKKDKVIGSCGIHQIDNTNRTAVLGIFIGDKEERNKGYGTEAIKLLLDFGFNYLNLHSIKLDLMEFNERALKCYQKCGFKEYGRRRKCRFVNGKYYDLISMDILREEFTESYIRNKNI